MLYNTRGVCRSSSEQCVGNRLLMTGEKKTAGTDQYESFYNRQKSTRTVFIVYNGTVFSLYFIIHPLMVTVELTVEMFGK